MYSVAPPPMPSANMYHNIGDMGMYGYNAPMSMGKMWHFNNRQQIIWLLKPSPVNNIIWYRSWTICKPESRELSGHAVSRDVW